MQAVVLRDSQATGVFNPFERIAGTKALMVPEILGIILSLATRLTLVSAARVSKAWSSIALDKLWSGDPIMVPDLLRALPIDINHMTISDTRMTVWQLARDPTEEEWARLRSNASRVRSLAFSSWDRDTMYPRITKWVVEKDVLFPRLRRIAAHFRRRSMPLPELHHFITPGLRELWLDTNNMDQGSDGLKIQSFLNDLATSEGLHLKKFGFYHSVMDANVALGVAVANLAIVNQGSIEALEVSDSNLNVSSITGHSFLNLKALSIGVGRLGGGGDRQPIHVLVEGCPHVAYLRIHFKGLQLPTDILDLPDLRMILTWHLLSFEVHPMVGVTFTKANLEEMARAWPKLKKLNLEWDNLDRDDRRTNSHLPFSHIAHIVSSFPQLEQLRASFHHSNDEETLLATYHLPAEHRCPSRLRKLRLGRHSQPPRSARERDLVARLLARVLPPGLHISFGLDPKVNLSPADLQQREWAAMLPEWFLDPGWKDLFRQIEELQGGVPIRIGPIDNSDGVWF